MAFHGNPSFGYGLPTYGQGAFIVAALPPVYGHHISPVPAPAHPAPHPYHRMWTPAHAPASAPQAQADPAVVPPAELVVVGSCMIDLVWYVDRLPKLGETLHARSFEQGFGGKGANQAVQMALLGGRVAMVGRVGDDAFGRETKRNFVTRGVDDSMVALTAGSATGMAEINVTADGANAIVIGANANLAMTTADVASHAAAIRQAKTVVMQLEVPLEVTVEAMRTARSGGAVVILNPAPASGPLPDDVFELCDYVMPNETEAEALTGSPVSTLEQAEAVARALVAKGARNAVITLGERGCVWARADAADVVHVPAQRVVAVDTTGAGDCFVGAFAVGLTRGKGIREALENASVAAAWSVQRRGTQSSFPRHSDLGAAFS